MLKKTILAVAALAVSAPVLADGYRGHRHGHGHGHRISHHQPHYVVHHRPVVVHRPAPVVHHVYHRPAPRPVYVVEQHRHVNPFAVLVGAAVGAAIVHHVVTR